MTTSMTLRRRPSPLQPSERSAQGTRRTVRNYLKILGEVGLVHGHRRGRWAWYSLDRERLANLRAAIDA
jgi:DNA-binding transcriptional ArsR family regulator